MLAPKGPVEKITWQRISRSVDYVEELYDKTSDILHLNYEPELRIVGLKDEVNEWRAILRSSRFLEQKDKNLKNIHGELLNQEIVNLSSILEQKRKDYYKERLNGKNLENIRLPLIKIHPDEPEYEDSSDEE